MGTGPDDEFGWSEPPVSADRRAVRKWLWIGCLAVVASLVIFAVSAGILTEKYLLKGVREHPIHPGMEDGASNACLFLRFTGRLDPEQGIDPGGRGVIPR